MIDRLLGAHPEVTAVIGRNVEFTMGALAESQRRGLRIPEDLSIVSYTDSAVAEGVWPRLTALRTPELVASRMAAEVTLAALAGEKIEPKTVTMPVELVLGETVGPPRSGTFHPEISLQIATTRK